MDEDSELFAELNEPHPSDVPLDPRVTPEIFREWRARRFGTTNPERMNNPLWEWLIRCKIAAYWANNRFDGPNALDAGPGWCFQRFGQSSTTLPDGRVVLIAGEHEDYYDPDFCIYNDVVVLHPDGGIDIYGYPREVFPPTDFHTATLIGNRIVIVGSLGYMDERKPGVTQVRVLDLETFSITSPPPATGTPPSWINGHRAQLNDEGTSILVSGGSNQDVVENINDWSLRVADWHWTQVTDRQWPRWEVKRSDGGRNHLFEYGQEIWARDYPQWATPTTPPLAERIGIEPNLKAFEGLYVPPIPHTKVPANEEDHGTHRILLAGVTVRYVENPGSIHMTVEGELPAETLDALKSDLLEKLTALENTPCELQPL